MNTKKQYIKDYITNVLSSNYSSSSIGNSVQYMLSDDIISLEKKHINFHGDFDNMEIGDFEILTSKLVETSYTTFFNHYNMEGSDIREIHKPIKDRLLSEFFYKNYKQRFRSDIFGFGIKYLYIAEEIFNDMGLMVSGILKGDVFIEYGADYLKFKNIKKNEILLTLIRVSDLKKGSIYSSVVPIIDFSSLNINVNTEISTEEIKQYYETGIWQNNHSYAIGRNNISTRSFDRVISNNYQFQFNIIETSNVSIVIFCIDEDTKKIMAKSIMEYVNKKIICNEIQNDGISPTSCQKN